MKNIYSLLLWSFLGLTLLSCSGARHSQQLSNHQNLLQDYSQGNMPTEKKIDALATSFIKMMNESMDILNPKKGVAYVKKYNEQNGAAIDTILKEIDAWQENMDTVEKISFVAGMLQKPYTRELFELVPKFERKFRQIQFVMDLTSKFKKGLGNLLGRAIGL